MKTFTHSGAAGDIIYSLPTIQCAGGGLLYLTQYYAPHLTRLLESQPCIAGVAVRNGEIPDIDLDKFREHLGDQTLSLAGLHLKAFGFPQSALRVPWLKVENNPTAEVVFNRSPRYGNTFFPWRRAVEKYRNRCVFVGLWQEHQEFCAAYGRIPFRETCDLLQVAQIISGAKLFIGNQSSPAAIAEGLKVPMILVVTSLPGHGQHCIFHRPDAGYYVAGGIEFPDV